MKIVVLVKEVPDTYSERTLDLNTGLAARDANPTVLDEITERALEVAIQHAEKHPGTEVVALSMGPASVASGLRRALALGADSAVHISDDELIGADLGLTAAALASAVKRVGFDLVVAGNSSTDGVGGVIPAMIAELLDIPQATSLSSLSITDGHVTGERLTDTGVTSIAATLPAVISITEAMPDARVPSFKGIMAAKKKPLETLSLTEVGVAADNVQTPRSIMLAVDERPARAAGVKIADEGDAVEKLAEFLIQNRLV